MKLTPRFLDGVMLAANAMPNLVTVLDAHRCELEREAMADAVHDWVAQAMGPGPYSRQRRVFAPSWSPGRLITGTEDRLSDEIDLAARRHPGDPILVCRSALSLLINSDTEGVLDALSQRLENPLLLAQREFLEDDWIDGIRAVQQALFDRLADPTGAERPHFAGFCLHRREGDEIGNVLEVERLLASADLAPPDWPFDGRSFPFKPVSPAAPRFVFPLASGTNLAGAGGQSIPVELPIGIQGTCDFLRAVAAGLGQGDSAERLIEAQTAELGPKLSPFFSRVLGGKGVALVADPWRLAALASAVTELGMGVPLAVALRRRDDGDCDPEQLAARGVETLLQDPDRAEVAERLLALSARGLCDVVLGAGVLSDEAAAAGLPSVEVSGPYRLEHFATPTPTMGFAGMLNLAERLSNAISRNEHARGIRLGPRPDREP